MHILCNGALIPLTPRITWHALCLLLRQTKGSRVKPENQPTINPQRSSSMNKILLSALGVVCMAGIALAADKVVPQPTPEQIEYNNMVDWLYKYYNSDKEAMYQMLNGISDKIKTEYPMDQKIVDAVNAIRAQSQAAQLEVAKKYGFTNYNDFYGDLKYHPEKYGDANAVWAEINQVGKQYSDQESNLTAAYREDLNKRILAAEIEAVERLQGNAKAMK
jgi:hypothetical protein